MPPYDPATGKFKDDEELSVSKRLTGLLSKDNPYLKQAETRGLQQANRRGLANSTMAVSAVENERIGAALPIASQEAGEANQRYMQGRSLQAGDVQQVRGIEATERMQGRDIESRESLTREGFDQERFLQQFDANIRQQMQQLDVDTQLRIANMNVAAAERNQAAGLAASFEGSYANLVASIMSNPDIPSTSRQQYLDHATRIRDNNLALVEQMYGIELEWETLPVATGTNGSGAGSGTTASGNPPVASAGLISVLDAALAGNTPITQPIAEQLEADGFNFYDPVSGDLVNAATGERWSLEEYMARRQ